MKIIGLTGPSGSGKSTVSRLLAEHYHFLEFSFADPIRDFIDRLAPQADWKEGPCEALCGRSPRYAMQTLGTEWGRQLIGPELWLRYLATKLARYQDCPAAVIADVRFENEAAWVRQRGELWHLQRPGIAVHAHSSEAGIALTDRDVILDNNCGLDDLAQRIDLRVRCLPR